MKPFRPERAILEVTDGCTLRCASCNRWRNRIETIAADTACTIQTELAHAGVRILTYLGGEPFLHPDLLELARFGRRTHLRTAVVTNGTLLSQPKIEQIAAEELFETIIFSLDGIGTLHDAARGTPGAFARAAEALACLVAEKRRRKLKRPKIYIYMTVSRVNCHGLAELFEFARRRSVNAVKFIAASVVSKELKAQTNLNIGADAVTHHNYEGSAGLALQSADLALVREQLRVVAEASRASGVRVDVEEYLLSGRGAGACVFLGKDVVIDMAGRLHLCPMLPQYCAGSALDAPLAQTFAGEELTRQLGRLRELAGSGRLPICTECCVEKLARRIDPCS